MTVHVTDHVFTDVSALTRSTEKVAETSVFLRYIHSFRGIAILFIVAGHCIDAFIWENNESLMRALRIVASNGSLLFVFISGYLFQHLSYKYEFGGYLRNKLTNVLLPYFIVSIPAIVVFTAFARRPGLGESFYGNPLFVQVTEFYLTGAHLAPLWFVPMITVFYLLAPLLVPLDRDGRVYYGLAVLIPLSLAVPRGGSIPHAVAHFFSVYLLGMLASRHKARVSAIVDRYALLLAIAMVLLFAAEFWFMQEIVKQGSLTYVNYLSKLIACFLFVWLLEKYDHVIEDRLSYLASISFGIFFVHSYVISGVKFLGSGTIGSPLPVDGTLVLYLAFLGVVVALSMIGITSGKWLLGKHSRTVIGC